MSSNAPQQAPDEAWRPRRIHGGLRQLWRGRDKQLHFRGQEPDEVVRKVVRRHPWFLIRSALPFLGSLLLLIILLGVDIGQTTLKPLFTFLTLLVGLLVIITAAYFVYKDLILWWLEVDIITNKRILTWRGFLQQTRQETGLDRVQQVGVDRATPMSFLASYGTVHVYLVGGRLDIKDVPNPKAIRDAILGVSEAYKAAKQAKAKPPRPANPELDEVLSKLAKEEDVPKLQDADAKYARRQKPDAPRGPLRTFGGPLRIPADVHYQTDEFTVMYIQRSRYVLAMRLTVPVLLLLLGFVGIIYLPHQFTSFVVAGVLILIIGILLTIINYFDDVFILTNKRIIDIERKFIFFYEARDETEYRNIRDVKVRMSNVFEFLLGYGDVYVETPGSSPDIKMTHIDHPFFIQDKIYAIKGFKEKADKIEANNKRKQELNEWFSNVVTILEKQMVNRGVPNLQKLDLLTAVERAEEFGMKVVPIGEVPSYPQIPAGVIVSQEPPAGAVIHVDLDTGERPEIRVLLSK
ncbi:MAG TPA: PH domain-containing protein [Ktedonobacteraceae bacterium]|nr:PH domain-containing protein [Ktedonobacteraceae bacterium]